MQVVDIGCGDGGYAKFCSQRGADITFVDIQESKVAALEARLKDNATGKVKGIVSECNPIPLPDGYADLVISTEVIEHVQDPEAFLSEIVRIGGPNATYVLTVPDARGENLVKTTAPEVYFQEPNHIQIFSSEDFETLASNCGLEVVRHDYLSGFWSIFFLLKWATAEPGETMTDNAHPTTYLWTQVWDEVLKHPNVDKIRDSLNQAVPKSQMIIARRKGADLG
jgi:SAM-dependent methyltransferase